MIDFDTLDLPPLQYLTRKEILAIEAAEFSKFSSEFELMQHAGKAVANHIKLNYLTGSKLLFCLGPGNNGGDGYVAISHLQSDYEILAVRVHEPKTATAQEAAKLVDMNKITICEFRSGDHLSLQDVDLIIDSIFGIGLQTEPREPYDQWLKQLASTSVPIISVDLPSGLDCDFYRWYGIEFYPKTVVTMQYSKAVMKEWDLESDVLVVDIGFHRESEYIISKSHCQVFWENRAENSHKGQNGRVMVIGGSDEFTGAPVLSGKAILRSGVDTLRIAVPESIRDIVAGYNQDFIVVKVKGERHNSKAFKRFRGLAKNRHDVVVMGMGLSNHKETRKFVREIVKELQDNVRLVLDADAIRPFKHDLDKISKSNAIITPHKAELRHLLQEKIPFEFSPLVSFVQKTARDYNLVILLKGKIDIITDGRRVIFNTTGNAAMTVGGTGDVLAGIVAAVNCFVDDKLYATAIAAYIMGKAGDLTYDQLGIGLLASDIVENIPVVLQELGLK